MKKIIRAIDFADGGDGLIQFTEFVLAACSKKNLLSADNMIKEFRYIDSDQDGEISVDDIRKFLQSYSESSKHCDETSINNMITEIITVYRPDQALKTEEIPTEWRAGPRSLSYNHFSAMLNEINDSIARSIDGKVIEDAKKHRRKTKADQSLAKAAAAAAKAVGAEMAATPTIVEEATSPTVTVTK